MSYLALKEYESMPTWKHYWAVMWKEHPYERWDMMRFDKEADAKEYYKEAKKRQLPDLEFMEQYVQVPQRPATRS